MQQLMLERKTKTAIDQRRFEQFVENQRFEEKTDLGERIGYHIDHPLQYEMHDGAAYCLSDTKHRPFHDQTLEAKENGKWKFIGENAFQAERLALEHDEALDVDAFGRGELGGNVFIKVSKVPDAIVSGTASVDGYRRDLMRSFIRIYYRTSEDRFSCLILSLDGNSRKGFSNVEKLLGISILNRSSEDILADQALFDWQTDDIATQVSLFKEKLVREYDDGVYEETGRKTYAGSDFTDQANAMRVVDKHNDLFEQHWQAINEVTSRILSISDKESYLEDMRRRTAAAIKLRETGVSVGSIGEASVVAEAESGEYGRECATNGMNQAEQAISAESWKWEMGTCRVCLYDKLVGPCILCKDCTAADNRGESLARIHSEALRRVAQQTMGRHALENGTSRSQVELFDQKPVAAPLYINSLERIKQIRAEYGNNAEEKKVVRMGTQDTLIVNRRTGEILAVFD